ncbi:hypothetical protein G7047_14725 [Diaphorobacter sp. HDW4A]|uniref:hypothetical protein n=1 Tax=Diaphorobacter sp. HDW4A TaxID=2714924 RepID=UPI00140B701D|nr:hypothetical protein [Diaphorobacter sp. HDW4A]QIL81010.1 hypothetical protein G7047_14725 [Diaphorobacter sp. HDW4A]
MSEVITRPKSGKTKSVAPVPATQQTASAAAVSKGTQRPEWLALALPHLRKLSDFLTSLVECSDDRKAPELIQNLAAEAEGILSNAWGDCTEFSMIAAITPNAVWSQLNTVVLLLRSASYLCKYGPLSHGHMMIHVAVIDSALAYASGMCDAMHVAPQDLGRLTALDGDAYLQMDPEQQRQLLASTFQAKKAPHASPVTSEHIYSASHVDQVFSSITTQSLTLRDFLIDARVTLETEGAVGRAVNHLMVAESLACLVGSVADHMCKWRALGGVADWVTGDGIERIGGDAA